MDGHVYIAPGDVTQLAADAVAFSASSRLTSTGTLYPAFARHFPTFGPWYESLVLPPEGRCPIGATFWLSLDRERKPCGIVVVASTGGPATEIDKATIAVRAAVDTAVARLRNDCGRNDHLLVALPAFRVGMGGDRRDRLRSARAQVGAALEAINRHPSVDVAFVTYTPALYRIFLEARRELLTRSWPEPAPPPALIDAVVAGESVLFVGAGLSHGAGLPDWSELIRQLAEPLHVTPDGVDALDLAQWYRERFGAEALAAILRRIFGDPAQAARPTLAHYLLLGLPTRLVLTTNYDNLIERALAALKRPAVAVLKQQDVPRTGRGAEVHVVKLHGDAATAQEIVLCRDDYDEFFEKRPAMALLLEGLLLNRTFFFVGYALRDPNFRQVHSRIGRMLREAHRPAFATLLGAVDASTELRQRQWQGKQVHLTAIPGTSLAEQERGLLRFLDRLATEVALRRPGPFLAPDVDVPPALAKLRTVLAESVGEELEALARQGPATDAAVLGPLLQVLEFLTAHGWRPGQGRGLGLCDLCESLATQASDPMLQRRLLGLALVSAEAYVDVERIQARLAMLPG